MDDPEVRAIAGKYGDPEEILCPEGAEPIPGITAPGDYLKDYARDPVEYWVKQRDERKAGTSPYLVTLTSLELRNIAKQ